MLKERLFSVLIDQLPIYFFFQILYFKGIHSGKLPYIRCADIIIYSVSTALVFHVVSVYNSHVQFVSLLPKPHIQVVSLLPKPHIQVVSLLPKSQLQVVSLLPKSQLQVVSLLPNLGPKFDALFYLLPLDCLTGCRLLKLCMSNCDLHYVFRVIS